ncbi:GTP cyclohydrolase II domain containing protein [Elaphomyces granulatus]
MAQLPAHSSPYLFPRPLRPNHPIDGYSLTSGTSSPSLSTRPHSRDSSNLGFIDDYEHDSATSALPASIISPALTPPNESFGPIQPQKQIWKSGLRGWERNDAPVNKPKLLDRLPNVECIVRARIPTTTGAEMFLHLYQNDVDDKEHLAIVFGNNIRSRSLDRVREGETEMDRMIRGAYVGRLHPGRVSSRCDGQQTNAAGAKLPTISFHKTNGVALKAGQESAGVQSASSESPLVRIHSECYTGETAWSARCDCGEQLDEAARLMSTPSNTLSDSNAPVVDDSQSYVAPGGVIIYLRQEGRGIGLGEKLKAYNLQDLGSDTVEANLLLRHPADARSYGLATAMLVDLGLGADSAPDGIRLLTNNPDKVRAVEGPNREVLVKERVPMIPLAWRTGGKRGIRSAEIEGYLRTKVSR